nr:N-alpha-acetyltransferase 60 [Ciona intestinalis]|eukprot:XP_002125753.1 N-alpha-acetyltransferase 60 [Ciona intestinalis]
MSSCVINIDDNGLNFGAMKLYEDAICEGGNGTLLSVHNRSKKCDFLSTIRIRSLNGGDIDVLRELCTEWFPIKYPVTWYESITYNDRFFSIAATLNGQIIAILIAEIKPRWQLPKEDSDMLASVHSPDSKVAYILSLGVQRDFRRRGVASYILHHFLLQVASKHTGLLGVKAVYLHVLCTNVTAIKFYERHNFQLLHYLPAYYVINMEPKDGYSYVLYMNGGKPPRACCDCLYLISNLFQNLTQCKFTKLFFNSLNNVFSRFVIWPKLPSIITRQRQCHNL